MNLWDFVLFIVFDGLFKLADCLLEAASLGKNHANEIEY
jgi:hypothetical protein